jgi:hypothetical protein
MNERSGLSAIILAAECVFHLQQGMINGHKFNNWLILSIASAGLMTRLGLDGVF